MSSMDSRIATSTTAEWLLTHEIACSRVEASLRRGDSVVVDDTNCFRSLRDSYRAVSSRYGARAIIVHVGTSLDVAWGPDWAAAREGAATGRLRL